MRKWLNKEYTIDIKIWELLIDIIISAIIITALLYLFICDCGNDLINVLNWINNNHLQFKVVIVMFPIILIITSILIINIFNAGRVRKETKKGKKK